MAKPDDKVNKKRASVPSSEKYSRLTVFWTIVAIGVAVSLFVLDKWVFPDLLPFTKNDPIIAITSPAANSQVDWIQDVSGIAKDVDDESSLWLFVESDGLYYPRPIRLASGEMWTVSGVYFGEENETAGSDFLIGVIVLDEAADTPLRRAATTGTGIASLPPGVVHEGPLVRRRQSPP